MSKLTDILTSLWTSEKAIITDDGQRTMSLESVLPEVEGYRLFDESVPDAAIDVIDTEPVLEAIVEEPIVEAPSYASADDLQALLQRVMALEDLIRAVDNATPNVVEPEVERW